MKGILVDLDGTLCDTKEINYRAYSEAIESYGFHMDYEYYCNFCNGRHYMEFLPQITTENKEILLEMHKRKKVAYGKYLKYARLNDSLIEILKLWKTKGKIGLVTTASKENTYQILQNFNLMDLFDLILTHDDVSKHKPDPEGYLKAMKILGISPENCIVFEDTQVGVEAAEAAGATVFVARGFN